MVAWLRFFARRPVVLTLRTGIRVACRPGTSDWAIVHELMAGSYSSALRDLAGRRGPGVVLDLGGNIGCFSLWCAALNRHVHVIAYEPEASNLSAFRFNLDLNPHLAGRVAIRPVAVAGLAGTAVLNVPGNLAAANIIPGRRGTSTPQFDVEVRAFSQVVQEIAGPIHLVKMDIEGSEFSILESTSSEVWARVPAVAMEIHDDPALGMRRDELLNRLGALGYTTSEDPMASWFARRAQ